MANRNRLLLALVLIMLMLTTFPLLAGASRPESTVLISEIRTDHLGADVDEYFELVGAPGESLAGVTYLVWSPTSPTLCPYR